MWSSGSTCYYDTISSHGSVTPMFMNVLHRLEIPNSTDISMSSHVIEMACCGKPLTTMNHLYKMCNSVSLMNDDQLHTPSKCLKTGEAALGTKCLARFVRSGDLSGSRLM